MKTKISAIYKKYERHINTLAFAFGYIFDNLTMVRIDVWYNHATLIAYLVIAAFSILVLSAKDTTRNSYIFGKIKPLYLWLPIVIQFSLGAVFSGSLVFYSRSSTLSSSWPFLILLLIFLIGNERIYDRYSKLTFQITGFFLALFLYMSFTVPILARSVGTVYFIAAGILSLMITYILLRLVRFASPDQFEYSRLKIFFSLFALYAVLNVMYFSNLIPPLPLTLKYIGVFHSVSRDSNGDYNLIKERVRWYDLKHKMFNIYFSSGEEDAYVYSSIFAPSRISADIIHEWFYYDKTAKSWRSTDKIIFPITGGRDGGYRGYSIRQKITEGKWKVEVKTENGKKVGKIVFEVIKTEIPVELQTVKK